MPDANEAAIRLWYRMIRLQARMNIAVAARLKEFGLSIPQCDVLSTLTEGEGMSQQELASRLYVTKGNISGLVDRLVAAKLVERRPTECDRRSYAIYLTPAGRRLAHLAIEAQHDFVIATLGKMNRQKLSDFEALVIETRDLLRNNGGASRKDQARLDVIRAARKGRASMSDDRARGAEAKT